MKNPMTWSAPLTAQTALFTVLHLLVDGLCACTLLLLAPVLTAADMAVLFVTYNVLAFMSQPVVGTWMDRTRLRPSALAGALALLIGGALLALLYPRSAEGGMQTPFLFIVGTLLGMGNSLFHVYGGIHVAQATGLDMRHLGFFVSSGALGLALGGAFVSTTLMGVLIAALVVVGMLTRVSIRAIPPAPRAGGVVRAVSARSAIDEAPALPAQKAGAACGALAVIALIVFGRAFFGGLRFMTVGSLAGFAALSGLLAFAGKAAGGFVGMRFGAWPSLAALLSVSGVCLLLADMHWAFALLVIFSLNLTMPLTLYLANRSLPHREGLAFGVLAAVLVPGTYLSMVGTAHPLTMLLVYPLVATLLIESLVLVALGERRWQVFGASGAMNVATNVPLNVAVCLVPAVGASLPAQLGLEGLVLVVETIAYWFVVRRWPMAFGYALACNAVSYLCGVVFGLLFY